MAIDSRGSSGAYAGSYLLREVLPRLIVAIRRRHQIAGGAALGKSLRRPVAGILRRRNDRRADRRSSENQRAAGHFPNLVYALQGREKASARDRQRVKG